MIHRSERMRQIYYSDLRDYDDLDNKYLRVACRAIIIKDNKLAMIKGKKFNELKFPGGGLEQGETHLECLMREVVEETGLIIDVLTQKPFGLVTEIRKSTIEVDTIFQMNSYYYTVSLDDTKLGKTNLDPYEIVHGYELIWVDIHDAITTNKLALSQSIVDATWIKRELKVMELLKLEALLY